MRIIKKLLGVEPKLEKDGSFSPSKLALKLATSNKTNFEKISYKNKYQGNKKILVLCTEEKNMKMANRKLFSTGNHPVEMLVPMLYFEEAGFDIDVFTINGKSVKIEMWAMPRENKNVENIFNKYKNKFENPKKLSDLIENKTNNIDEYLAVFIPGGHGAMLELPNNENVGKLLHLTNKKDLFLLTICHAPAVLLASKINNKDEFIYKGYKMAVFPDKVDEQSPMIGYMPGHLT